MCVFHVGGSFIGPLGPHCLTECLNDDSFQTAHYFVGLLLYLCYYKMLPFTEEQEKDSHIHLGPLRGSYLILLWRFEPAINS